jgi:hypothetical protein
MACEVERSAHGRIEVPREEERKFEGESSSRQAVRTFSKKVYAVRRGYVHGLYATWPDYEV